MRTENTKKTPGAALLGAFAPCPVIHTFALAAALVIALHLLLRRDHALMAHLSENFVRPVHAALARLNSHVPFSVAEALIAVAAAAVLALLCALLLAGGAFGYVTLDGKLQKKQAEIDRLQEKTAFFDQNAVCVNDDGSMLYHRYGCARLEPDQCRIYSRKTAEAGGYEPCPDCFGS